MGWRSGWIFVSRRPLELGCKTCVVEGQRVGGGLPCLLSVIFLKNRVVVGVLSEHRAGLSLLRGKASILRLFYEPAGDESFWHAE